MAGRGATGEQHIGNSDTISKFCQNGSMVRALYRFHIYYYVRRVLMDCRFLYHMKLVLTLLTILTLLTNSLRFVRIMDFLMIL